ncbi:CHAT domain-containing protein [Leptolyngbya ohadii]|uniref:CHAT domain-containing protein n=1 Tax=Leptolyngbya ohadii TaxID=1962290 RepID=UPI000B5A1469|nr:CHAT domain-containing protein [Leptolyngbya ohadii]
MHFFPLRFLSSVTLFLSLLTFLPMDAPLLLLSSSALAQTVADRKAEADRLFYQGEEQYRRSQFREALESWQAALQIYRERAVREAFPQESRQAEGATLNNLGAVFLSLKQPEWTITLSGQALAIARQFGLRQEEGEALLNLASAYAEIRQDDRAIAIYQQRLALAREIRDWQGISNALVRFSGFYMSREQYTQAIDLWNQQLAFVRQDSVRSVSPRESRHAEAEALKNLSEIYREENQIQAAIDRYEEAREIARSIGNRLGEAQILKEFGNFYRRLNQYDRAVERYEEALATVRQVRTGFLQERQRTEAEILSDLGIAYLYLRQDRQAIELYEQGLDIIRATGDRRREAKALRNLGRAYLNRADFDQAIERFNQGLTVARAADDRHQEAILLGDLGEVYYSQENYEEAIGYFEQQLRVAEENNDSQAQAEALNSLGVLYKALEQNEQSIEFYQRALIIARREGDPRTEGAILSNIGVYLVQQNQPQLAIVFLKEAVNVWESLRGDLRPFDREFQQRYIDTVADDYRLLADLLLQTNRVTEARRVLDLLKVQELDEYLQDVKRGGQPPSRLNFARIEREIFELYNTAVLDGLELAQLQAKEQPTPEEQARLAELNQRQHRIVQAFHEFIADPEVQAAVQQLRIVTQSQIIELSSLRNLQGTLQALNQDAVLLYPLILENRLELVLVTPNSPPIRRPVDVSAIDLNRLLVQMGQALGDSDSAIQPIAQQLYRYLIQPIEADLQAADAKTIIYAPDGALRYIPLAALHNGDRWLAERYAVTHITAVSLATFLIPPSYRQTNDLRILAAACAECSFNFQTDEQSFEFRDLPYAGSEVEMLAKSIPGTEVLMNRAFNADVVPQMRRFPIIHLATHAAFVPGEPLDSFIVRGDGERMTLRDISSWNIPNADLMVLSACETAVGETELGSGIEILGFGHQMQEAGAKATIASLWQVSDGGTKVLMSAFYAALRNGKTKTEALQLAQQALITGDFTAVGGERGTIEIRDIRTGLPPTVRDRLNHPYYWAPFILIGNSL